LDNEKYKNWVKVSIRVENWRLGHDNKRNPNGKICKGQELQNLFTLLPFVLKYFLDRLRLKDVCSISITELFMEFDTFSTSWGQIDVHHNSFVLHGPKLILRFVSVYHFFQVFLIDFKVLGALEYEWFIVLHQSEIWKSRVLFDDVFKEEREFGWWEIDKLSDFILLHVFNCWLILKNAV